MTERSRETFRSLDNRARRRNPCAALITHATIVAVLLMGARASAQDVTEPSLKAVFIYNFALFTEWPADVVPAAGPFVLCVLGDAAVSDALQGVVKGRVLAGHTMAVSQMAATGPQRVCHVLYVSGVTVSRAAQVVAELRDVPVLTISDVLGFTELGGIAQFFFESGRLRFNVEVAAAKRAHLQISSKLLALATRK